MTSETEQGRVATAAPEPAHSEVASAFNLQDPDFRTNAYGLYEELREKGPVSKVRMLRGDEEEEGERALPRTGLFTNESYLVTQDGKPQLYIWHQLVEHGGREYLIGGWFVCAEEVDFSIAMVGLKWQLEMTGEQYPGATWIAIIKKTNDYVNLLNRYMGFTPIDPNDDAFAATAKFFNDASPDEFNYVQLVNPA